MKSRKKIVIGVVVLLILIAVGYFGYTFYHNQIFMKNPSMTAGKGYGSATAESAMADVAEGFGSAKVTQLGNVEEAMASPDPVAWLLANSEYTVDPDAVAERVDEYKLSAESASSAMGVTYDDVISQLGYDSEEDLVETATNYYTEFIAMRAVVFAAAEQEGITLSVDEYQDALEQYAQEFGYSSAAEFENSCEKDSIANEMLYDKTVAYLRGQDWPESALTSTDTTETQDAVESGEIVTEESSETEIVEETMEESAEAEEPVSEESSDVSEETAE